MENFSDIQAWTKKIEDKFIFNSANGMLFVECQRGVFDKLSIMSAINLKQGWL